ncbi:hypothetical protein BU25DRAFT_425133 [Macroventuria anomochaeta]|uniref:Uncharacterized protein n=1 Tax=Macroventuria anomochaeta TaxID=301207 RepID=A0ACB6RM68_9PLEO|nr:uncharacterized protein BU25DRAFT_425133 [Macroventuria anomochaeta]KAF2623121.1 hypothetical protein BU25DRAFT_425133 [Macroventuria anomochaeta]
MGRGGMKMLKILENLHENDLDVIPCYDESQFEHANIGKNMSCQTLVDISSTARDVATEEKAVKAKAQHKVEQKKAHEATDIKAAQEMKPVSKPPRPRKPREKTAIAAATATPPATDAGLGTQIYSLGHSNLQMGTGLAQPLPHHSNNIEAMTAPLCIAAVL